MVASAAIVEAVAESQWDIGSQISHLEFEPLLKEEVEVEEDQNASDDGYHHQHHYRHLDEIKDIVKLLFSNLHVIRVGR